MSIVSGSNTVYPVSYTIPDDGDDIGAAELDVGFEALGDRTAYLKSRTQYFDGVASLQASADHVEGSLAFVQNFGVFYFNTAATGADITFTTYRPNDIILANPGRWILLETPPYTKTISLDSGANTPAPVALGTTATLCDTFSIVVASARNAGANIRLHLDMYAQFTALYTAIPANVETRWEWYVEVQRPAGAIMTSDTFVLEGANNFMANVDMAKRQGFGQFATLLNAGNGTYDVRLYALRVDVGATLSYSNFIKWGWKYSLTEGVL